MKILLATIAIALLSVFPGGIERIADSHKLVDKAECITYSDTVVLALKTQPIFFRSDRVKLISDLESEIRLNYDVSEVIITFDKDIYYKITKIDKLRKNGVSENELREDIINLIETVRARET